MSRKKAVVRFDNRHFVLYDGRTVSLPFMLIKKQGARASFLCGGEQAVAKKNLPQGYVVSRPFSEGKIVDKEGAVLFVTRMIKPIFGRSLPELYILIEGGMPKEDRDLIESVFTESGFKEVFLLEKPYVYARLAQEKNVYMVASIEVNACEAAFCMDGSARAYSFSAGLQNTEKMLTQALCRQYNLKPIEEELCKVHSFAIAESGAIPLTECFSLHERDYSEVYVIGKDSVSAGERNEIAVSSRNMIEIVRFAYERTAELIHAIRAAYRDAIAEKINQRGVLYLGEGTRINGFTEFMTEKTGLSVQIESDAEFLAYALNCVAEKNFLSVSLGINNE